jgi:hypothetical protein
MKIYTVKEEPTSTSNLTIKFNSNLGSVNFSEERYPTFTHKCVPAPPTHPKYDNFDKGFLRGAVGPGSGQNGSVFIQKMLILRSVTAF